MKKKFIVLLAAPILFGCEREVKENEENPIFEIEVTQHNYFEIKDKLISWSNIFAINYEDYYVYFYSPTCMHCASIRDWIIEKALVMDNLYFVEESQADIIERNIDSSIGATSSDEISILGYPSLIEIEEGKLVKNLAGVSQIKQELD